MKFSLVFAVAVAVLIQRTTAFTDDSICQMTDELRQIIVKAHNMIRQSFASGSEQGYPTASCMNELVWDNGVEAEALVQSATRKFDHDPSSNRHKQIKGKDVMMGQNLGMAEVPKDSNGSPDYNQTIYQFYFDEKSAFLPSYVDSYPDDSSVPAGHLSQIIWAKTAAVGCGTVLLTKEETKNDLSDDPRAICMLTCNYAPPGNFHAPTYISGPFDPKNCMKGASSTYANLCAPPGYLVDNSPDNQCPTAKNEGDDGGSGNNGSYKNGDGGNDDSNKNGGGGNDGNNNNGVNSNGDTNGGTSGGTSGGDSNGN